MSWWKRSKYKQPEYNNWYDEEAYTEATPTKKWSGYAAWKPKYDMSVGLETRVTQLIRTITGKTLKLQQAEGWGNTEEHFFYNPEDLQDVTDDEVLGRILQQLAGQVYVDNKAVTTKNEAEPAYRHLLATLEVNRADRQLAKRYPGTSYYADELWQNRKFTDSPFTKYRKESSFDEWLLPQIGGKSIPEFIREAGGAPYRRRLEDIYQKHIEEVKQDQNDAWEFCFNINAFQNKEENFDFSKDKIADDFAKALLFINEYLEAEDFEQALKVYSDIQKYYPVPSSKQQKQMDERAQGTQGLSAERMEAIEGSLGQVHTLGKSAEEREDNPENFIKEFAHSDVEGFWDGASARMDTYKHYQNMYLGQINTLFNLIRSILKDNIAKRFVRPFKRGKIDGKRMYKYIATDNLRIFKKPRVINDKDYLMSLVVDMSGSMSGSNARAACQGAIVMAEVLEKLKFPYEVLAYNGSVYTVKGFGQSLKKELLTVLQEANGDNNELAAINTLTRHITKFDGANRYRKSIFWITDGEAYSHEEVKRRITKLEQGHKATVFAIGIGSSIRESSLKSTYNHYMKVNEVSHLPTTLVGLMRAQFRRG